MPTPYDNHDGGFTRADYRIAADYNVNLDASEQVRCDSCNKLAEADELNKDGDCLTCAAEIHAQECAAFVFAPTMAGCKALMGEPKAVHVSESDRRFEYRELRGDFSNAD